VRRHYVEFKVCFFIYEKVVVNGSDSDLRWLRYIYLSIWIEI
jgi:hypothetical protein